MIDSVWVLTAIPFAIAAAYATAYVLQNYQIRRIEDRYRRLYLKGDASTVLTVVEAMELSTGGIIIGTIAAEEIAAALEEAKEHGVLAVVQSDDSGVYQTDTFIGSTYRAGGAIQNTDPE